MPGFMEGQDARRPRAPPKEWHDSEARTQCSMCCGLRIGAMVFGSVAFFTFPPILMEAYMKKIPLLPWTNLLNKAMLLPLMPSLIATSHHWMMSSALWSKNEKTIWDVQWECMCLNMAMWYGILIGSTIFSRTVLAKHSREYRVMLWDWKRQRRSSPNKLSPPWVGKLTEHIDFVLMGWAINCYHLVWLALALALDWEVHSQYAFFYTKFSYSKWCSPRWREKREVAIKKKVETELSPVKWSKWGNYFTADIWRESPQ
jgi:hypothetical protein